MVAKKETGCRPGKKAYKSSAPDIIRFDHTSTKKIDRLFSLTNNNNTHTLALLGKVARNMAPIRNLRLKVPDFMCFSSLYHQKQRFLPQKAYINH